MKGDSRVIEVTHEFRRSLIAILQADERFTDSDMNLVLYTPLSKKLIFKKVSDVRTAIDYRQGAEPLGEGSGGPR